MTKFNNVEDIVNRVKETADDIVKAVLYPPGGVVNDRDGVPLSGPVDQFALVLHLTNNEQAVFGRTAEAVLNDGILNRMRIPIEFGVGR